jgi:hypothetical protein
VSLQIDSPEASPSASILGPANAGASTLKPQETPMKTITAALISACMAMAASAASAQDTTKKDEPMAKDGMMKRDMTMQQCKDHMAMSKKDGMKKDDAMMKMDTMCADMMKKDGMKKDTPADPMKK